MERTVRNDFIIFSMTFTSLLNDDSLYSQRERTFYYYYFGLPYLNITHERILILMRCYRLWIGEGYVTMT